MMFGFAYPIFLIISLGFLAISAVWRWFYYHHPVYIYPLAGLFLQKKPGTVSMSLQSITFFTRFAALILLILVTARMQFFDEKIIIPTQGIDIMLVLDASGSMAMFDDPRDQRARFEVAKTEAINFINKRVNDPIGIVIFGLAAASRCPMTLDKYLLNNMVKTMEIGCINPDGTVLSTAIAMAATRMRHSTAKSKVMIVLTDGTPSPEDIDPKIAAELAQKFGIKIYTIGIGSDDGGYMNHPLYGLVPVQTPINKELMRFFAHATAGQFFEAKNPDELQKIYALIDEFEKSEQKAPTYQHMHDYFMPFLWIILLLLIIEVIIRLWWLFL
jgi:Ca-activated chloride channel homolog